MDGFDILDPRFRAYVLPNAPLVTLGEGFAWLEGPVWFADHGCLLVSDLPIDRIMRWTDTGGVSVFRQPSGFANGHTRDLQGRLVGCSTSTAASPGRSWTAASPCWRTATGASGSTGRTTWSAGPTARSGSPTRTTESTRITKAARRRRNCRHRFTGSIRKVGRSPSPRTGSPGQTVWRSAGRAAAIRVGKRRAVRDRPGPEHPGVRGG